MTIDNRKVSLCQWWYHLQMYWCHQLYLRQETPLALTLIYTEYFILIYMKSILEHEATSYNWYSSLPTHSLEFIATRAWAKRPAMPSYCQTSGKGINWFTAVIHLWYDVGSNPRTPALETDALLLSCWGSAFGHSFSQCRITDVAYFC